MKKFDFKNVIRKDDTKRMLIVTRQTPNSLEANIEEVEDNILKTGTPINAEIMNEFQDTIILAEENSTSAKIESSEAKATANSAVEQASNAINMANEAIETSMNAEAKASIALENVINLQGTKVIVGGEYVPTFDVDTKADKSTVDNLYSDNNVLASRIEIVESNVKNIKRNSDTTNLEGTIVISGTLVI